MIHCDASLLVALTAFERFSEEAEAWFDGERPGDLAYCGLNDVEVASAPVRAAYGRLTRSTSRS